MSKSNSSNDPPSWSQGWWRQTALVLRKALAVNSQPTEESFPELPTVLSWFRCVLGLAYGLWLSHRVAASGYMVLQALNLITFFPVVYCRFFLRVQADHFSTSMIFSGTGSALALCLLLWIYFFTAAHESQEEALNALMLNATIAAARILDTKTQQQDDFGESFAAADVASNAEAQPAVGVEDADAEF